MKELIKKVERAYDSKDYKTATLRLIDLKHKSTEGVMELADKLYNQIGQEKTFKMIDCLHKELESNEEFYTKYKKEKGYIQ